MLRIAVALGTTTLAAAIAFQQAPRAITLRPPDATLGEPFTSIYSIRELADGRLLMSDNGSENRLVVVDLRTGSVKSIGRLGSGPGEFQQAGRLSALSSDTTLFLDATRARKWLMLVHDSIVATIPPDWPPMRGTRGDIHGADLGGRMLSVRDVGREKLANNINRRRLAAVLVSRKDGPLDTVAHLRGADERVSQAGTRERPMMIVTGLMGSVDEQAILFPDGWIGIVRVEPYRVDWRLPNGTLRRGPDLYWETPRSDAKERRAFDDRQRKRRREYRPANNDPWADRLAPIRSGSLSTPEGSILVARSQWSRVPDSQYDLVDRAGSIVGRLALPDSERVIGFGRASVYVVVTDGDGFQFLRRHPWP